MAYTPTTWNNGASPAINAPNLNKMEQGIKGAWENPVFRKDDSNQVYGYDPACLIPPVSSVDHFEHHPIAEYFYMYSMNTNGTFTMKANDTKAKNTNITSSSSYSNQISLNKTRSYLYYMGFSALSTGVRFSLARSSINSAGVISNAPTAYGSETTITQTPIEQFGDRVGFIMSDTEFILFWGGGLVSNINISSTTFTHTTVSPGIIPVSCVRSPDSNYYYCLRDSGVIEKRHRGNHSLMSQKKVSLFFTGGIGTKIFLGDDSTYFYLVGKHTASSNVTHSVVKIPVF